MTQPAHGQRNGISYGKALLVVGAFLVVGLVVLLNEENTAEMDALAQTALKWTALPIAAIGLASFWRALRGEADAPRTLALGAAAVLAAVLLAGTAAWSAGLGLGGCVAALLFARRREAADGRPEPAPPVAAD